MPNCCAKRRKTDSCRIFVFYFSLWKSTINSKTSICNYYNILLIGSYVDFRFVVYVVCGTQLSISLNSRLIDTSSNVYLINEILRKCCNQNPMLWCCVFIVQQPSVCCRKSETVKFYRSIFPAVA